jgi:hypothetical protein
MLIIISISTYAQDTKKGKFTTFLNPKIGFTYQNTSKSGFEDRSLQWLANVNGKLTYDYNLFSLSGLLFVNYGQLHRQDKLPEKTQDNIIMSVTPTYQLDTASKIRLFLESTFETTLREGRLGQQTTRFMDPGFFYQSLYLGQKKLIKNPETKMMFEANYGIGYAYQLVIKDQFLLNFNPQKPDASDLSKKVSFESGASAFIEYNYTRELIQDVTFNFGFKTTFFARDGSYTDVAKIRVSSLAAASLKYKFISLDYQNRLLYDANLSLTRDMTEALVLSFSWVL